LVAWLGIVADPGSTNKEDGAFRRIRRRTPLSLAVLASLLLLVAAAAAAAEEWAFLESEGQNRIILPDTPFPLAYVAMAGMAILLMCVLALRLGDSNSPPRERGRRSALRPIAMALVLLAIWLMLPSLQGVVDRLLGDDEGSSQSQVEQSTRPEGDGDAERTVTERSRPLGWAVVVAFALAAIAVIAALIVLLRQSAPPPTPVRRRAPPDLLREIEASEADLRTIDDPRAAVIACYSRMQKAVSGAGVDRRESDTPFELLERMADDGRIPHAVARRLTELFETAKFSLRPVDEGMRMQALDCLRQIREALEEKAA
jgi:Domain of unknown function (DUF4129)